MRHLIIAFIAFLLLSQIALSDAVITLQTSTTPSSVYSGADAVLNLDITNSGTVGISTIKVRLLSIASPLQIQQMQSGSFGALAVGSSLTIPLRVTIPKDTPKGLYNVLFEIEVCQSTCAISQSSAIIEVKEPSTNFEVGFQSADEMVSLSVANVGINSAIAVSVSIPSQDNFYTIGASTVFLGNLNSGEYTVADFKIASMNNVTKGNLLTNLSYTDPTGERHTIQKQVYIDLSTKSKVETKSYDGWQYLIIIAVALAAIFFWRKRKKK